MPSISREMKYVLEIIHQRYALSLHGINRSQHPFPLYSFFAVRSLPDSLTALTSMVPSHGCELLQREGANTTTPSTGCSFLPAHPVPSLLVVVVVVAPALLALSSYKSPVCPPLPSSLLLLFYNSHIRSVNRHYTGILYQVSLILTHSTASC